MIVIIHIRVTRTLKASTLNSRRSERPAVKTTGGASTLKGSPELMGDPFRVDVVRILLSGGTSNPRLLSGDTFSVNYTSLRIIFLRE